MWLWLGRDQLPKMSRVFTCCIANPAYLQIAGTISVDGQHIHRHMPVHVRQMAYLGMLRIYFLFLCCNNILQIRFSYVFLRIFSRFLHLSWPLSGNQICNPWDLQRPGRQVCLARNGRASLGAPLEPRVILENHFGKVRKCQEFISSIFIDIHRWSYNMS